MATSITLNTGGSGGLFTPSLFVGAAIGGAFGVLLTHLFPTLGLRPEAYALVGMGAVTAASTAAPITGILLVFEMTNDYAIVLPLMLTTVIANLIARGAYTDLPVVDGDRRLVGIITLADLGRLAGEQRDLTCALVAHDVTTPAETVTPGGGPPQRGPARARGPRPHPRTL